MALGSSWFPSGGAGGVANPLTEALAAGGFDITGVGHLTLTRDGSFAAPNLSIGSEGDWRLWHGSGSAGMAVEGLLTIGAFGVNITQDNDASNIVPILTVEQTSSQGSVFSVLGNAGASLASVITSRTTGAAIQGFFRTDINSTTYWIPFYSGPTS